MSELLTASEFLDLKDKRDLNKTLKGDLNTPFKSEIDYDTLTKIEYTDISLENDKDLIQTQFQVFNIGEKLEITQSFVATGNKSLLFSKDIDIRFARPSKYEIGESIYEYLRVSFVSLVNMYIISCNFKIFRTKKY